MNILTAAVPSRRKLWGLVTFGLACCALGLFAVAMANLQTPEPWPKLIAKTCVLIGCAMSLVSTLLRPEQRFLKFVLLGFAGASSVGLILVLISYRFP